MPTSDPISATSLAARLHPPAWRAQRHGVGQMLQDDLFRRRDGLSHRERVALTYERVRVVGRWAAPGSSLVADRWRYVALMESLALVDPALFLALGVHFGVCLGTLARAGGSGYVAGLAADLDDMKSVGCIATTELGHGTSHGCSRTVALFDPGRREFILRTPDLGAQKFMANVAMAGVPKIGLVYATVVGGHGECGVFPFVVPLRDSDGLCGGVHVSALGDAGATTLDHSLVSFDDLRVPHESWLRGEADFDAAGTFHDAGAGTRLVQSLAGVENMWVALAAGLAAAARATAAMTAHFAGQRLTAGGLAPWMPVISYRNQQEAVFGALAAAYGVTFLVNRTLANYHAAPCQPVAHGRDKVTWAPWNAMNHELALTKVVATATLERIVARCRQRCGAQAILAANRFLDYEGLAHAANCIGGDNQLVLLDAARNLVLSEAPSAPAVVGGEPAVLDLRDSRSLVALFELRERRLLAAVGERVRSGRASGASEFDAWNDALVLACAAMEARGLHLLLEAFHEAADAVEDRGDRAMLAVLLRLYTLEQIGEHAGWYLAEEVITAGTVREIPEVQQECYDLLLPCVGVLVDALDVPEALVQAPIMSSDYVAAFPAPAFLSAGCPRREPAGKRI